jgi:uncharacterized SAM-dependent methyltransferase
MAAIPTRVLLTESQLADDFVAAFEARDLPERFFYWFPLSVRAWLELCSDREYRNYVRSRSLIATSAAEIAGLVPDGPAEVLSLGSGQGDKDLILVEALRGKGGRVSYTPVDTSQALLELACGSALAAGVPAEAVKADVTDPRQLDSLRAGPDEPPRLVMLIGNTLGAFDPMTAARTLGGVLREDDLLLVDGEIFDPEATIGGYDNPLNRRFAWAPLHAVGIGDEDGTLSFAQTDDPTTPGLHFVTKWFEAARAVDVRLGGQAFRLEAGERIDMSRSGKYADGAFERILGEAGLDVRWQGLSEDGRFTMALVARADAGQDPRPS